jgi:diguanylate cyclase (GGDEF)-like protein
MNALLVLDLDNFKSVNDKLGHLIGDAVIMDMAMNLKMTFRKTDILGHIGGDEFMVMMKDIKSPEIVMTKCKQLRDTLRKVYTHEGEEVSVSASIGIALSPEHGTDYNLLFTRADAALAESKRQGKDTETIFSEGLENDEKKAADNAELPTQNFRKMLASPMEYIFQMVFNSKDTSLAVQLLLQIFAKYFKVHRAYVFWHLDGHYWPKILFDYVRGNVKSTAVAHDPPLRLQIRKRYRNTKHGRFSECSDTSKLVGMARREFEKREIRSYLECAVMDGEEFIGSVGFDDCKKARTWTKEEHEILFAFSEIMRRFLFGQIFFEMKKRNGRLIL